jgi:hypothetical protein
MLSKPIQLFNINTENLQNEFIEKSQKSNKKNKTQINISLSYSDYIKDKNGLRKYKLPELKSIAKNLRLHITGTKPVLIERIEGLFERFSKVIKIQRIIRGFIVKKSFQLRGEAFKNRAICVNNTDFYTLEPLNEIDFEVFYSYKDEKNFQYGFNVTSLIKLMKNKNKEILNPYNREPMTNQVITDIFSLYKKIHLLFPYILEQEDMPTHKPINNVPMINNIHNSIHNNIQLTQEIQNKIRNIREKPIQVRINELFMEIDQLGNYTESTWFSRLSIRDYVKLYRSLYDIWNYRAQLSHTMKQNICILGNPFYNIFNERIYYNEVSLERIQEACLIVFENMVYTGIDIENRKIGTMHALSALTLVSQNARDTMPWLYDSVAFS